jgi:hypothetical protein
MLCFKLTLVVVYGRRLSTSCGTSWQMGEVVWLDTINSALLGYISVIDEGRV